MTFHTQISNMLVCCTLLIYLLQVFIDILCNNMMTTHIQKLVVKINNLIFGALNIHKSFSVLWFVHDCCMLLSETPSVFQKLELLVSVQFTGAVTQVMNACPTFFTTL